MEPTWNSSCASGGTIDGSKWTADTGSGWAYVNSTNYISSGVLGDITVTVGQADETLTNFFTWFGFADTSTCEHQDYGAFMVRAYSTDSNYKFYRYGSFVADSSAAVSSDDTLKLERLADGTCKFYVNGTLNYTYPAGYTLGDAYATCSADRPTGFISMGESPLPGSGHVGLPPQPIILENF